MNLLFKTMVLALAGMILVFYGVGFILVDRWSVTTTRVLPVAANKLEPLLTDLAGWREWSQMEANLGPQTAREVVGAAGAGQRIHWSGGLGHANLRVTKLAVGALEYEFTRQSPEANSPAMVGSGCIAWRSTADGVEVSWTDAGQWSDMAGRWIGWFGALQDRVRQLQTGSLTGLEAAASR